MVKNGISFVIRGACLCGGISFDLTGELKAPTICHCGMCRRWHGSPGTYTTTPRKDVRLSGTEVLRWYRSGPSSERGFCGKCGSSLFWRQVDGDYLDITMGALNPPTGLRADRHIWVAHRGDYQEIGGELPQYAGSSARADPIAPVPPLSPEAAQPDAHTGNCLCGAVAMTISGRMRDISICHCRQCLRWHGDAPGYSKAKWTQIELAGAEHLHWYRSSDSARRGSCNICGSSLFWEMTGADAVSITAGCLNPPTGLRARHHIFVGDKEDYSDITDGLPQFPGTGGAALPF
jgi:hypothetical protein